MTIEKENFLQLLQSPNEQDVQLAFQIAKQQPDLQVILNGYLEVGEALFKNGFEDYAFMNPEMDDDLKFSQDEKDIARSNAATTFQAQLVEYIPASIQYFTRLTGLKLSGKIQSLPLELMTLPNLEELWLWNNELKSIPSEICQLQKLRCLSLSDNQLTCLPPSIQQMQNLESLFLGKNPISETEQTKIKNWLPHCHIHFDL